MTNGRPRRRSIFSGLLLILLGALILWHNLVGHIPLWDVFRRWWPLLLILWGLAKLYDHLAARRTGQPAPSTITGGEILLVFAILCLLGTVAMVDWGRRNPGNVDVIGLPWPLGGTPYSYTDELAAKEIPANSRITVQNYRGDIIIRAEDTNQIRVVAKMTAYGTDEKSAESAAKRVRVAIGGSGSAYSIEPQGRPDSDSRVTADLEIQVPRQSTVNAESSRGEIQVSGVQGNVSVNSRRGNIEIRKTGGDVNVTMHRGDVRISGSGGNVKVSGRGSQVELIDARGAATIEGEFFGPIRVEKIDKGLQFSSRRTDLTVTKLPGRIETDPGAIRITNAPGDLTLTTRRYDITADGVSGRIRIENNDGNVRLRFAQPPREAVEVSDRSGNIELTLPANSAFNIQAEATSGEVSSDFAGLVQNGAEGSARASLSGAVGTRGPRIVLKTTYGTIRLRKAP